MWRKECMQFIEEIDICSISLFILMTYNQVHLLQLVVEFNALHSDIPSPALLKDLIHQGKFIWA